MTPNEYLILRMFADTDHITIQQVAERMQNSVEYAKYLCAGMVNCGLLVECTDDSGSNPVRACRLTPKSWSILTDLWRGMADNLRRRAARFYRVGAIVEGRADQLGEKESALRQKITNQ